MVLSAAMVLTNPEIAILFEHALLGDYESEDAWAAISALRQSGSREVFERAAHWCRAEDPLKRARAAAVLCQLRRPTASLGSIASPEWLFRDEAYALVVEMVEQEEDPLVLDSAISALGHLDDPRAIPLIIRFHGHAHESVRFAVAFALGCFPNDDESVRCLLRLMSDEDADVRDWAVFGLGVLGDADSPAIRDALLRCLDDADEDVREEAAVGLGKRRDERLLPKLLVMLDGPSPGPRVTEAATALLGLDREPDGWSAADYKAALRVKVQSLT
jgi:HEAT repeat protein